MEVKEVAVFMACGELVGQGVPATLHKVFTWTFQEKALTTAICDLALKYLNAFAGNPGADFIQRYSEEN